MSTQLTVFFVMGLVLFHMQEAHGARRLMMASATSTWDRAATSCKSGRGTLAVLDSPETRQMFDRDIDLTPAEKVWIGRFIGYTHTVAIDGCYSNVTLGNRRTKILQDNYLVTCMTECPGAPYIGMQGTLCYCLDSISPQAALVPGIQCHSPCPGEQTDSPETHITQCGRQDARYNTVSVYRRVRPEEIRMDVNIPDQGECIAYNVLTQMWQADDCGQTRLFACDRKPCPFQQMCVFESTTSSTWYDGRTKCEGNGGYLATVNMTTNSYFNSNVAAGTPIYWTGLHRKEVTMWTSGEIPSEIVRSDRCIALVKLQDGGLELHTDWCSREYRYICLEEYTVTQSVTSPVSTVTTSSSTIAPKTPLPTVNPYAEPINVTSAASNTRYSTVLHLLFLLATPLLGLHTHVVRWAI